VGGEGQDLGHPNAWGGRQRDREEETRPLPPSLIEDGHGEENQREGKDDGAGPSAGREDVRIGLREEQSGADPDRQEGQQQHADEQAGFGKVGQFLGLGQIGR
jgi:hypothetical protein